MIRIFFGDDRAKIQEEIRKIFADEYEVFEGVEISYEDMPSLFFGMSILAEKRKILIKDFSENKEVFPKISEFLNTEHEVILFESRFDKRTAVYKDLKAKNVLMTEFKKVEANDVKIVFDIFDMALKDGKKAVEMLEKIEATEDPFQFFGLMSSQALKKFEWKQGEKEKRVLRELSKLDIKMKTTSFQPWLLVKSFLLQVSSL